MSIERAAMKGKLAGLKEKLGQLKLKAEGLCNAIRQGLNTTLIPVEELEIPQLDVMMDDLVETYGELLVTQGEISKVERALA